MFALSGITDVVIVSLHAGQEYTLATTQLQEDYAHTAIDAGASVVIGHHPHVVQRVEEYQDGYIFYSLGNFIFDQIEPPQTREGVIATLVFRNSQITDYSLTPVYIEHYSQPRILTSEEGKNILERMLQ